MSKNKEDRRRFFRITDAIGVAYEVVNSSKPSSENSTADEKQKDKVDVQGLLEHHNQAINDILLELRDENPLATRAIEAVNKKLDTLLRFFELDSLSSGQHFQRVDEASISACGIAFPIEESLSEGTELNLTMHLKPSEEKVDALGKVVGCQELNDEEYYLRVEFIEMNDAHRESLIQHIVQRQGALLRSLREQLED
jgi:c-di-GMP-binding flagellar brake protein YcgR